MITSDLGTLLLPTYSVLPLQSVDRYLKCSNEILKLCMDFVICAVSIRKGYTKSLIAGRYGLQSVICKRRAGGLRASPFISEVGAQVGAMM